MELLEKAVVAALGVTAAATIAFGKKGDGVRPGPPSNFRVEQRTGGNFLMWDPPADTGTSMVKSYILWYGKTPGANDSRIEVPIANEYMLPPKYFALNTDYYLTASAVNDAGEGLSSAIIKFRLKVT